MNSSGLIVMVALSASIACVVPSGSIKEPAPPVATVALVQRYSVDCGTRSPGGFGAGFHDPRKGGECWACPNSNPVRSWAAVNQPNACATKSFAGIGARTAAAKYLGPYGGCPRGDVQRGGVCLYCPSGSAWNAQHGACVKT